MITYQRHAILVGMGLLISLTWNAVAADFPEDWIRHSVSIRDSRAQLPEGAPRESSIEIAELPYRKSEPPQGAILMVPGLFQNAYSFDLAPEQRISFARHVMQKFKLRVYLLHVRGLGKSGRSRGLNLDDFAIDDIPHAIRWVSAREASKVILFGNSQGAIMLQASLSGLTRGPKANFFDPAVARKRQDQVRALALSAGSTRLESREVSKSFYPALLGVYRLIEYPLRQWFDHIDVDELSQNRFLAPVAHSPIWSFLYLKENVSPLMEKLMFERSFEASWAGVLLQFGEGIADRELRTAGLEGQRNKYSDGAVHIQVPVLQVTFEKDPFSEPGLTRRYSHRFTNARARGFFEVRDRAHEDYLMNPQMHSDWDIPLSFLVRHAKF